VQKYGNRKKCALKGDMDKYLRKKRRYKEGEGGKNHDHSTYNALIEWLFYL